MQPKASKRTQQRRGKYHSKKNIKKSRTNIGVNRRIENLNKMLDERTPSPSFDPPAQVDLFQQPTKKKRRSIKRNGRAVQSMVQNDFEKKYTRTETNLKETIDRELKLSLSQAKEQFAQKMKKDEVGARWRGQGSVRTKTRRNGRSKSKRKLQTKSVMKVRRPQPRQLTRTMHKAVGEGISLICQDKPRAEFEETNQEAKMKFEVYKNELVDIYSISHFDVKWIERELDKIQFNPQNPFEPLVRFQNRIIRIIALRLKNEKQNRFRTEKQFQVMMERYSKQIQMLND